MADKLPAICSVICIVALLTLQCGDCRGNSGLGLASGSKPLALIVLPADPAPEELKAAEEIRDYVRRISGATLDTRTAGSEMDGLKPVFIGGAADASLENLIGKDKDAASFALVVKPESVSIRGLSPEGTLFGAYELLEQLGVRWFMPGELGTVVPKDGSPSLRVQQTVQSPSFASRWHSERSLEVWQKHVRMGGPRFPSSHGVRLGPEGSFEEHPEYYALVNGVRTRKQLCVSNPEVIRLAAASLHDGWNGIGPNDGGGFCECANCRALDAGDFDPYVNLPSVTDRYIWFFNKVLEAASSLGRDFKSRPNEEGPNEKGVKIGFYAYDAYMRPPLREKPNPRITPALAPINLCRIHGVNNPRCPEKNYLLTLYKQWTQLCPEVYDRGYWFNLADIGLPFSMVHRLREDIPAAKRLGIKGWRVETSGSSLCHWASETPSLYLAAKLMWNSDADVDALLADFYEKFFGPAAKPMRGYFETMDAAVRDADYHTGSDFDMPFICNARVRTAAGASLRDAERAAGKGVYRDRVDIFAGSFHYLEAFLAMIEHRNAFNFAAANADLKRVDELREKLAGYNPPMLNRRFATRFLDRFFRACTEEGFQRTTGVNDFAAGFADEWDFFLDAANVGLDLGIWRAEVTGGNWQKIKTSASWSDQGLRYYKGVAWYRQNVTIPKKFQGRKLQLWFGGVDEKAKVWVNGKELGESQARALRPFEFDATAFVRPGEENTVVVRVENFEVDELGTGGITAPVMFYSPLVTDN